MIIVHIIFIILIMIINTILLMLLLFLLFWLLIAILVKAPILTQSVASRRRSLPLAWLLGDPSPAPWLFRRAVSQVTSYRILGPYFEVSKSY